MEENKLNVTPQFLALFKIEVKHDDNRIPQPQFWVRLHWMTHLFLALIEMEVNYNSSLSQYVKNVVPLVLRSKGSRCNTSIVSSCKFPLRTGIGNTDAYLTGYLPHLIVSSKSPISSQPFRILRL